MKEVVIEETFEASIENVWSALIDVEQMKKWYFDLPEFKAEVGFEFKFVGQGVKGESYVHLCSVTEVILHKKLQYSWEYENQEGYSLVTFELSEQEGKTHLKLIHSGLDTFPQGHPDFKFENFKAGWTELITKYLTNHLS